MKMKITNTSRALQGVHSTTGLVFIEAGATLEVDVAKDYVDRVKSLPYFSLGEKRAAKHDENGDTPEMADLRRRFDAAWTSLSAEHETAKAGLATAQAELKTATDALTAANDEIGKLKDEVAGLQAEIEKLAKFVPAVPEAKHRGAGSYSIMEGETEVRDKLTKEQAEAFQALDAEGRAKWLVENPKA